MKNIYNFKRLAAYSAMAAILVPVDSSAEVIYHDIEDMTIGLDEMFDLDVDGDAVPDFHFRAAFNLSTGGSAWSFGTAFGYYTEVPVGNSSNQVIGYPGPYYYYASFLNEGDPIGPDGPWLNYPSFNNHAVIASNFYGLTYGAFPGGGQGYLGVQFLIGTDLHYGWIRLESDVNPVYITIFDMAYESVPDTEIEAGSMESVAISNSALKEVSIYTFGNNVYVNNPLNDVMQVEIYSISGELVTTQQITSGFNTINVRAAAGNYLVRVSDGVVSTSTKVYLQGS